MSRTARVEASEVAIAALGFMGLFVAFFGDTMFGRVLGTNDGPGFFQPFYDRPRSMWTDSLFAGYPVSGDPQSGFFNPIAIVLKFAGFSFDAFVVAGYVLCGVGGFALGKALTGSRLAGVMAGVTVSMSAFIVGHLDHTSFIHTAGWTVCALAAAEVCCESGSWKSFLVLAVSLPMMMFAGSPQVATYGAAVIGARLALGLLLHSSRSRFVAQLAFVFLTAGLLSLVVVSPAFELVGMSMRSALTWENFISNSYQPGLLPSLVFPTLFMGRGALQGLPAVEPSGFAGIIALLLAGAGALTAPRRSVLFWSGVVVLALLFALGPSTPIAKVLFHVPGWNLFRGQARHFFEFTLGVAALAAYGVASIERGLVTGRHVRVLGAGVVALVLVLLGLLRWSTPGGLSVPFDVSLSDARVLVPMALLFGGVLLLGLGSRFASATAVVLVVVATAEAFVVHRLAPWRNATPLESTTEPASIQIVRAASRPGERIVVLRGYWDPDVPANSALSYGIGSASGYSPLEPRAFADATGIDPNGVVGDHARLLDDASTVLDVLAIGLVVAWPEAGVSPERFERAAQLPNGVIFRNLRARPRAWFVPETIELDHDATVRAVEKGVLPDGRRFDPATTAIVERLPARRFASGCAATVTRKDEGLLEVATRCDGEGFLVVSERGFPGWRASIDGRAAPLRRVDLLVTGLEVPAGNHVVELKYAPSSVWVGVGGGLLGLALALAGFLNRRRWFDQPQPA
ncbi:MAG: hypothetical protein Q8S33_28575 [Myxococcales bacterium]|nr:hypothetical protein [Myxococcales bacterium]